MTRHIAARVLFASASLIAARVSAQEKPAAKDTAYVLPGISVTTARHAASHA